ncbi:alpha/beta hydrolase [Nocardia sp. NPDC005978]|uniref:alpha/beta hydrolase n=1 Tax=Nocardia sp. NPDC005978 TaxID=3156725 RepID=UPI0033A0C0D9
MSDYLARARAAGCEPAVSDWLATVYATRSSLPQPPPDDWIGRRTVAREISDILAARFTAPGPAACEVTRHRVPTRAGQITVVHYRPPTARPRMAHLIFHGGGFVLGSVDEDINNRVCRTRALAAGVDFFDVDYRLAPEHKFPAALEDCLDVLHWLRANAAEFGFETDRIGVGGISAGGNLAAMVAVHARDLGVPLDHQILEVPATDLHIERDESFLAYAELNDLGGDFTALRAAYLGADHSPVGPAAPAEVADLSNLAPALVITAELDPLRDSGEAYAAALAAAGVPVRHWRAPGHLHGSGTLTLTSPTARAWQDLAVEFLRSRAIQPASTHP